MKSCQRGAIAVLLIVTTAFLFGCGERKPADFMTDLEESFVLSMNADLGITPATIQVSDAQTGELVTAKTTFEFTTSNNDTNTLVTFDGEPAVQFTAQPALVQLFLNKTYKPSGANTVTVGLLAAADGYDTLRTAIEFLDTLPHDFRFAMNPLPDTNDVVENLPEIGASAANFDLGMLAGHTAREISLSVSTDRYNDLQENQGKLSANVKVPSGTYLLGASGDTLTGPAKARIALMDGAAKGVLKSFDWNFFTDSVIVDGTKKAGCMLPACIVPVDFWVGTKKVSSFTNAITITVDVSDSAFNGETHKKMAAGDSLTILRDAGGKRHYVDKVPLTRNTGSGNLQVQFETAEISCLMGGNLYQRLANPFTLQGIIADAVIIPVTMDNDAGGSEELGNQTPSNGQVTFNKLPAGQNMTFNATGAGGTIFQSFSTNIPQDGGIAIFPSPKTTSIRISLSGHGNYDVRFVVHVFDSGFGPGKPEREILVSQPGSANSITSYFPSEVPLIFVAQVKNQFGAFIEAARDSVDSLTDVSRIELQAGVIPEECLKTIIMEAPSISLGPFAPNGLRVTYLGIGTKRWFTPAQLATPMLLKIGQRVILQTYPQTGKDLLPALAYKIFTATEGECDDTITLSVSESKFCSPILKLDFGWTPSQETHDSIAAHVTNLYVEAVVHPENGDPVKLPLFGPGLFRDNYTPSTADSWALTARFPHRFFKGLKTDFTVYYNWNGLIAQLGTNTVGNLQDGEITVSVDESRLPGGSVTYVSQPFVLIIQCDKTVIKPTTQFLYRDLTAGELQYKAGMLQDGVINIDLIEGHEYEFGVYDPKSHVLRTGTKKIEDWKTAIDLYNDSEFEKIKAAMSNYCDRMG